MTKLNITMLCCLCLIIGWHLGWHVRGVGDERNLDRQVERRLKDYLRDGITSGLIVINDNILFGNNPSE